MARSVGRAVTDRFAAGRPLPLKPVLRGLQRVPGWEYLPARVKSVAMRAANPPPFCAACQQLVCTTAVPSRLRGSFEAGRCHTRGFLFK